MSLAAWNVVLGGLIPHLFCGLSKKDSRESLSGAHSLGPGGKVTCLTGVEEFAVIRVG